MTPVDRFLQIAPPHLPCGGPAAGQTEELMPGIGWVNAVPDAKATIDFEIAGNKLAFSGVGYHDKVRCCRENDDNLPDRL